MSGSSISTPEISQYRTSEVSLRVVWTSASKGYIYKARGYWEQVVFFSIDEEIAGENKMCVKIHYWCNRPLSNVCMNGTVEQRVENLGEEKELFRQL